MSNISRSKGNHTMKLGQFIEYNKRNIFFFKKKKSYITCDQKTIPRSFSKKSKLNICLDQQPKVLNCLLLLYVKLRVIEIY